MKRQDGFQTQLLQHFMESQHGMLMAWVTPIPFMEALFMETICFPITSTQNQELTNLHLDKHTSVQE